MITVHIKEFVGLPVVDFNVEKGADDYKSQVYRIGFDWDDEIPVEEQWAKFIENPNCSDAPGIIIGCFDETCDDPEPIYKLLLDNCGRFPNLRGLYLGEAVLEESEISWIEHSDITPFFNAYPGLEDFRIRGGGASLAPVRHIGLKRLVFESGGLPSAIPNSVAQCVFPELEHLEFFFGTDNYGWDGTAETAKPFLYNNPFPKLTYLGLRNCEEADEVAELVAKAPVLEQLEVLDLSLGNLGDEGGRALLESDGIRKLKKLDLRHHFLSDELMAAFADLPIEVDVSDQQSMRQYGDGDPYRYISITE